MEFAGMCKTTEEGPLDDEPPDSAASREADLRPYFCTHWSRPHVALRVSDQSVHGSFWTPSLRIRQTPSGGHSVALACSATTQ